jgi:glyoxylate reductase
MNRSLLVTDSLFIGPPHETRLREAGFEIERLDIPKATTEQLVEHLGDKVGYILGGIESVSNDVIDAAPKLQAIAFTGSGYTEFIPGHARATERGIAITAAKGANARDVAEFTIGLLFETIRNFPLLRTRNNEPGNTFFIARRIAGLTLGIIGYGKIGTEVAKLGRSLGMKILIHSRRKPTNIPDGCEFVPLYELLKRSDVVSLHVNKIHGRECLGSNELRELREGTILVNASFPDAVDLYALKEHLVAGRIKAAFDAAPASFAEGLPLGIFTFSNSQTAFNTAEANRDTSDRVTSSIINVLNGKDDPDVVNPEYRKFRK